MKNRLHRRSLRQNKIPTQKSAEKITTSTTILPNSKACKRSKLIDFAAEKNLMKLSWCEAIFSALFCGGDFGFAEASSMQTVFHIRDTLGHNNLQ